jgi:hypothetical protein
MIPLITTLLPSIMDVAGRFLPEDKEKRAEAEREIEAKLTESLANIDLAQLKINEDRRQRIDLSLSVWVASIHRVVMRIRTGLHIRHAADPDFRLGPGWIPD